MGVTLLFLGIMCSIMMGAKEIPVSGISHALFDYQGTLNDQLVRDVRLPRALSALLSGGLLASSGVMMQGILRNPIAEPSVLGITQGSVMFVALAGLFPVLQTAGSF